MAGHGWPTIANTDHHNTAMHAILFKASFDCIAQYARDTSAASVPMAVFLELHDSYNDLSAKQAGHSFSADSKDRLTRIENTLVELRMTIAAPRARSPSPSEYSYVVTSGSHHAIPSRRVGSREIIHRTCNNEKVDPDTSVRPIFGRNGETTRGPSLDFEASLTSSTWYPCVNPESDDAAQSDPEFEPSSRGKFVASSNDILGPSDGLVKEEPPIITIPARVIHTYPQYDHALGLSPEDIVSIARKRIRDGEETVPRRRKNPQGYVYTPVKEPDLDTISPGSSCSNNLSTKNGIIKLSYAERIELASAKTGLYITWSPKQQLPRHSKDVLLNYINRFGFMGMQKLSSVSRLGFLVVFNTASQRDDAMVRFGKNIQVDSKVKTPVQAYNFETSQFYYSRSNC